MVNEKTTVMPTPKGSLVNVIPTKENVDYGMIYMFNDPDVIKSFNFYGENRKIRKDNVKSLKRAMLNNDGYGMQFIPPIVVDINTMWIIDGQNRYVAFKEALASGVNGYLRVIFADVPLEYVSTLVKVYQDGKAWCAKDYFHRAKMHGVTACDAIEKWCMEHPELCMEKMECNRSYAMGFIYGRRVEKEVKDFSLTVTEEQLKYADKIYEEVLGMINAIGYKKHAYVETMAQAWFNIRKDSDENSLIDEMGMEFIYDNIYEEMAAFQPVTKLKVWSNKFSQIILNLYHKYKGSKKAA